MSLIQLVFDSVSSWTLAPLLRKLISDADEFAITNYGNIIVWHPRKDEFDGFGTCSVEALRLLETHFPRLFSVVSSELEYILGQSKCKKALAKYNRSMRSGTLYWNHLKTYNDSTRVRIMAGAIVHEAYHGKCYGVFGLNAYLAKKRMERICRNREVRFLNQISNIPDSEIHDDLCVRINMLNAPAI